MKSGEILGMMLLTEINLSYYEDLMAAARGAIAEGRLKDIFAPRRRRRGGAGRRGGQWVNLSVASYYRRAPTSDGPPLEDNPTK